MYNLYTHTHLDRGNTDTMINKILDKFRNFFDSLSQRQSDIDQYIYNKNPRDTIELEYWLRQYDRSRSSKSWI